MRTLDAIHLVSADLLADEPQLLTVVTRDARVRANAAANGHAVE